MSKKSRTRSRAGARKTSLHDRLVNGLGKLPTFKVCGVCAMVLVVLGGLVWAALEARKRVQDDERFFFDQWTLELGELPWWVTPEIEGDLRDAYGSEARERISLFDDGALDDLRMRLERSPWVHSATDIELVYPTSERPGSIRAMLVLRTPIAMVQIAHECYLVDADQFRLGEPYSPGAQPWFAVPRLIGVRADCAVPEQGEPWRAGDVVQGLGVARVLRDNRIQADFPRQPLDAIDVSNVEGRVTGGASEVDLIFGGRIFEWGRSPFSTNSQALSIGKKLRNLRRVLADPRFETARVVALYTTPLVGS